MDVTGASNNVVGLLRQKLICIFGFLQFPQLSLQQMGALTGTFRMYTYTQRWNPNVNITLNKLYALTFINYTPLYYMPASDEKNKKQLLKTYYYFNRR